MIKGLTFTINMCLYNSYTELLEEQMPGLDFAINMMDRGSSLLIAAPHGGGIEPGTSEIAQALAGEEFSYYIFNGVRKYRNLELHIPSTYFDEPCCLKMINDAHSVLTVHGCGGEEEAVYIGGLQKNIMADLKGTFDAAGFCACLDRSNHSGTSIKNICNGGGLGEGVQLEITVGLRRKMFAGLHREGRAHTTSVFVDFITAARSVFLRV